MRLLVMGCVKCGCGGVRVGVRFKKVFLMMFE